MIYNISEVHHLAVVRQVRGPQLQLPGVPQQVLHDQKYIYRCTNKCSYEQTSQRIMQWLCIYIDLMYTINQTIRQSINQSVID